MRRLLKIFLLLAVFLGGYYLGGLPNSPDIFSWARGAYHRVDEATNEIAVKAQQEDTSVVEAAAAYLVGPAAHTDGVRD